MVIEYFLDWVQSAGLSKRIDAASALVRAYLREDIDPSEREAVEAAITVLLEDPAPGVRLALAEAVGSHENVPRHVANALSADSNEIASKVLSRSPVFLDQELVYMIRTYDAHKQIAISCRPWLSQTLTRVICEEGCEEACLGILMNPASELSDENMHAIAERFGKTTEIRVILMERKNLPTQTRLLLINKLGEALNEMVSQKAWLTEARANYVVADACDKACIAYAANAPEEEVSKVVRSLINDGRVTVAFLLRAVCMGNITLAAATFAELSNIRLERVENILGNDKQSAFKAVYDRAGLPQSAFSIFQCAISTWRKLLRSDVNINQARMPFLVTREVLQTYIAQGDAVVDELLVLLRKLAAETARESAKHKANEISSRSVETNPKPAVVISKADFPDVRREVIQPPVQQDAEDEQWSEIFGKIHLLSANKQSVKEKIEASAAKINKYKIPSANGLGDFVGDIALDDETPIIADVIFSIPENKAA